MIYKNVWNHTSEINSYMLE